MDAPIDVLKIEHNVVTKELARFRPCDPETRCYFCREWAQFIYKKHLAWTGKSQPDPSQSKGNASGDCVLHAGRFSIKLPKFSEVQQPSSKQRQKERSTKLFDDFKKQLDTKNGDLPGDLTVQVVDMCEKWIDQPSSLVALPALFEPVEFDAYDESLSTTSEPKEPARLLDPLEIERQHVILPSKGFHLLKNLTGDILLSHKEPACEHMRPEWKSPSDLEVDRNIFNEKMAREVKAVMVEVEQALHESWRHLTSFITQVKALDKERNTLMGKDCQKNIDYFAQKQSLPSFQEYWTSQGDFKKKRADMATVDAAFIGFFDLLESKVKEFQTSFVHTRLDAVCTLIQKLWDLVVPAIQQMAERMASFEVKNDAYMESCTALSKSLDTLHPIDDVRSAVDTVRQEVDTRIAEYLQEIEALEKTYKEESRPNVAGRLDKVNNKAFKKQLKKVESGYYSLRQTFRYLLTQKIFPESLFCKFSLFCMEALMQEGELMEAMMIEREIKRFLQSHEEMVEERQYLFEDFEEGVITGRTELAGILGRLFLKEGMRIQGENLAMQRQNTLLKSLGVQVEDEQQESPSSKKKKSKKKKTSPEEPPSQSTSTKTESIPSPKETKAKDVKSTKSAESKAKNVEVKPAQVKKTKVADAKPKVPEVKPVTPKVPDTKVTAAKIAAAAAAAAAVPAMVNDTTSVKTKPSVPSPPAKKPTPSPAKPSVVSPPKSTTPKKDDEWQTMPVRSTSTSQASTSNNATSIPVEKKKKVKPEEAFPSLSSQQGSTSDVGGWGPVGESWASKIGESNVNKSSTTKTTDAEPAKDDEWTTIPSSTTTTTTTTTAAKQDDNKAMPSPSNNQLDAKKTKMVTKSQPEQKNAPPGLKAAETKSQDDEWTTVPSSKAIKSNDLATVVSTTKEQPKPDTSASSIEQSNTTQDRWGTNATSTATADGWGSSTTGATSVKKEEINNDGWGAPSTATTANDNVDGWGAPTTAPIQSSGWGNEDTATKNDGWGATNDNNAAGWEAPTPSKSDQLGGWGQEPKAQINQAAAAAAAPQPTPSAESNGWGQEPANKGNDDDGWGKPAQSSGWGATSGNDGLGGWGNVSTTEGDWSKKQEATTKSWNTSTSNTWEQEASKMSEGWNKPAASQAPVGRANDSDNWRQPQQQPRERYSIRKNDSRRTSGNTNRVDDNAQQRGWNNSNTNDRWNDQNKHKRSSSGWNPNNGSSSNDDNWRAKSSVDDINNGWGSSSTSTTTMPSVSNAEKDNAPVDVVNISMKDILQQSTATLPPPPTQPPGLIKDPMLGASSTLSSPLATTSPMNFQMASATTTTTSATTPPLVQKDVLSADQIRNMSPENMIAFVQNLQQENMRLLQQLIAAQQEMALQTTRYSEMMTISRERESQMMQLFEARKQTELEEGRRYILSLEAHIGKLENQLKAAAAAATGGGGNGIGGVTAGFGNQDLFAGYREEMRSNQQHRGRRNYYNKPAIVRCGNCGGSGHTSAECQNACRYCGSTEHLSEACHANQ